MNQRIEKVSTIRKSFLFLALLSLLFVPSVTSEFVVYTYDNIHDFTISSPSSAVRMCACSQLQDTIIIKNTGNYAAIFTLSTDQPGIVSYSDTFFFLESGQSKKVTLYLTANCDVTAHTTYSTFVKTNYGKIQELKKTIAIGICQNIAMGVSSPITETLPCTAVPFDIYIKNTGFYADRYTIGVPNHEQDVFVTENGFLLQPGENRTIGALLNLSCGTYGEQDIFFTAKAEKSDLLTSQRYNLTINDDYNYTTEIIDTTLCEFDNTISISLSNQGSIKNTYSLMLTGPLFLSLKNNTIEVAPYSTEVITLTLDSDQMNNTGSFEYKLTIKPEFGDLEQTLEETFEILNCHDLTLTMDVDTLCSDTETTTVTLHNNGVLNEVLEVTTPDTNVLPIPANLTIESEEEVMIDLLLAELDSDPFDMTLRFTHSDDRTSSFLLSYKILNTSTCKAVTFRDTDETLFHGENSYSLILEHTGYEAATYAIYHETANPWWKLQTTDDIYLEPGQAVLINFSADPENSSEDYYSALTLTTDDLTYTYEHLLRVRAPTWQNRLWDFVTSTTEIISLTILILLLLLFIIYLLIVFIIRKIKQLWLKWIAYRRRKREERFIRRAKDIINIIESVFEPYAPPKKKG